MAAREDDAASKRKPEEEEDSSPTAAFADECSDDDEADPFIRSMNVLGRLNVTTPEWIEDAKKLHREHIALLDRSYDALENLETDSDDDEAGAAEFDEWTKRLWASVDLTGLNTVGGESCGVDAVAVYPAGVYPEEIEEDVEKHNASAAAAESSSG